MREYGLEDFVKGRVDDETLDRIAHKADKLRKKQGEEVVKLVREERQSKMKNNLTRGGVCKDLAKSPFVFTYIHNGKTVNLFFSSKLHLDKFTKNRKKNYVMIYNDIYKRYKYGIDCTFLSDFNLYRKVESRGFYIQYDNNVFKCDSNIKL